jgi:hypothetical protein
MAIEAYAAYVGLMRCYYKHLRDPKVASVVASSAVKLVALERTTMGEKACRNFLWSAM